MLVELRIKNFAIIDDLSISFGDGLNIFTGETGAGKSIVIDAISLILGDRATNEVIRAEAEEACVEGMFHSGAVAGLDDVLNEAGIEPSEDLVIKRVVQRAGRNKIYINGSLATLMTLSEVGRRLIDIYGQSEHQSLTRPEEHIEILDTFAGLKDLREDMASASAEFTRLKRELDRLSDDSRSLEEKKDFLAHKVAEITKAALSPGEEDELKGVKERLRNAEKIKAASVEAESAVYSDSGSVVERIGQVLKPLKEVSAFDDRLEGPVSSMESALYQLEDAASFLRDYSQSIEDDPALLEHVGDRIELITDLKKKYGPTVEDVLREKDEAEKELEGLGDLEAMKEDLASKVKAAKERATLVANRLTEERGKAAGVLKERLEEELSTLGMDGTVFEAIIETDSTPEGEVRFNERGADRVVFHISPNPGEEIKPLARIASGGELSRIMLAMKRVTAAGRVPTLIFDEVDSGVGGAMAQVVGRKLNEVASTHQVVCITHLPQIAAFASTHYSVSKGQNKSGRTVTSIRLLDEKGRVDEISTMLGGMKVTETTREHAKELIQAASEISGG